MKNEPVRERQCRHIDFYVPGILDTQIAMLGTPASSFRLPTRQEQHPATREQQEAFGGRLHDLAAQAPSDQPNLLARYRSDDPPLLP